MLTTIPFSGFYNTGYSDEIDEKEKNEIEYMTEENEEDAAYGLDQQDVLDVFMRHTKYRDAYLAVAKEYVTSFNDYLKEEHGLELGLVFESMTSPKEYNFTTDRIFCHITEENAQKLFDAVDIPALRKTIKDEFTSRSGFSSFYNNDLDDWMEKPLLEWDYNEIGTMFLALVRDADDFRGRIFESMIYDGHEIFHEAWSNAVDWPAVEAGILELKLIADGEIEPDARQFPTGVTDPAVYVKQFVKLNNLLEG